jgi:hypothetical protein
MSGVQFCPRKCVHFWSQSVETKVQLNGVQFCSKKSLNFWSKSEERSDTKLSVLTTVFVTSLPMEGDKKRTKRLNLVAHAYSKWKCREGKKGNIDYLSAVVKFDFALRPQTSLCPPSYIASPPPLSPTIKLVQEKLCGCPQSVCWLTICASDAQCRCSGEQVQCNERWWEVSGADLAWHRPDFVASSVDL